MKKILIVLISLAICLTGCRPYKLAIQQGNILSDEQIARVHIGMSRDQVENILGTPVLRNIFSNELVYVCSYKPAYSSTMKRHFIVYLSGGRVSHIDAQLNPVLLPRY